MNIIREDLYSYNNYSRWSEIYWFGYYVYLDEIKEDLRVIEYLLNNNFKVGKEEFYKLIHIFYHIVVNREDILRIISDINKVCYDTVEQIKTRDIQKELKSEGHYKDFSWWLESYQKCLNVAMSTNFAVNNDYSFSNKEIKEMIARKVIFPLEITRIDIGYNPKIKFKTEEFDLSKINNECLTLFENTNEAYSYDIQKINNPVTEYDKIVYDRILSLIRKRLNNKRVLNDFRTIIDFLNKNIEKINIIDEYKGEVEQIKTKGISLSKKI